MNNLISIHLTAKPSVDDCATALRTIAIVAGFDVFKNACGQLPNVAGMEDDVFAEAGFGATPAAPAAPAAPEAPNPNAPAVDSSGLSWDERIHSGTKAVNQDGTWKKRRGVQESEVTRVTAELRGAAPAAPIPPAAPILNAHTGAMEIPAHMDRRTPAAPAAPAAPTPAPTAGIPTTFAEFMRAAGQYLPGNKITMAEINEICMSLGHASPMDMKNDPSAATLFPMAFEMVKEKANSKLAK